MVDRYSRVELPVKDQYRTFDRLVVDDGKLASPVFVVKRSIDMGIGGEDGQGKLEVHRGLCRVRPYLFDVGFEVFTLQCRESGVHALDESSEREPIEEGEQARADVEHRR